ncbi:MAG: hypothetical protein INR73_29350 [Williamsia sp.]|nr:hypothetical protein [Williamsia sp.]
MKQPRVIQRLSSLLLAFLLLYTAAWGYSNVLQQKAQTTKKVAAQQPKTGKSANSHSEDAQLSATQFEAVVTPAVQLGESGQTAFLLPAPTLIIFLLLSIPLLQYFTLPHFYFSYFQHVFGHHIATNAP